MAETTTIRWGIERRLEFIDFRLFWEGRINRSDLCNQFGISVPQASADLARYRLSAPDNMGYDPARKEFRAAPDFDPVFYRPSAERYLAQLQAASEDLVGRRELMIGRLPTHDALPGLSLRVDATVLRRIVTALHSRSALHVRYRSLAGSEPDDGWISPMALFFDGLRWHVRAWCHDLEVFRDLSLVRILRVMAQRRSDARADDDAQWQRVVVFRLGPHPDLPAATRRAVEADFDMQDGTVALPIRAALAPYLYNRLGLCRDPGLPPSEDRQVVLLNRDEIESVVRSQSPAPSTAGTSSRTLEVAQAGATGSQVQ